MPAPEKRPWWLGLLVVAIGALWFAQGMGMPALGGYAALGPGFFVTVVGALLMLMGGILIVQIARGETFSPQQTENAEAQARANWPSFLWALAGVAAPLAAMKPLGFPLTAMVAFSLVTRAFGSRRLLLDAAIGLVLGLVAWFGFTRLGVNLGALFPGQGG